MYPHQQPITPGIDYRMIADYEPQDYERCIRCRENDIVFVEKPFRFQLCGTEQRPEGWLYGTNKQTTDTGYIPAEYVEYVREIQPPPPVGLPALIENPGDESDSDIPPDIPPRILSSASETGQRELPSPMYPDLELPLQEQVWYWGNVSRDEVRARLADAPDGTFLVRNARNNPGEYTLTLCKSGIIKLIRICHRNGMYGFSEPYGFSSVVSLVNNYRREPLTRYNPELDITLKYPAKPFQELPFKVHERLSDENVDELCRSLREADQMFVQTSNVYQNIYNDFQARQQEIQITKTAISAYEETIKMFNEQCSTLNGYLEQAAGTHDEPRLLENFRKMQTRLKAIVGQCENLRRRLNNDIIEQRQRDQDLNANKAEMFRLKKLRDDKIAYMKSQKISDDIINKHLQLDDEEDDVQDIYQLPDTLELRELYSQHCIMENWYFPRFGRKQAEQALEGTEDGTFLIRDKDNPNTPYACSLVANGTVHHCLIEKTVDGYGFAEPFNLHITLPDLVLHYANNSLIPHNEKLDTTLSVPLGCVLRR
ncbi:unnamed protein product [Clavelina lepadiformis]|uniref:Phosphatidylinositol 3-kinase regulatory subunit alpha n=1 Tax=Clavelina lepadiformis TaxID=159417 RepID=A0ABP0GDE3_CLALP